MTITLSFDAEYKYLSNTEAVTLYRRLTDAGGFDGGTAIANAFAPESIGTLANQKSLSTEAYILWASQTGTPAPKQLDVIQDSAGNRWTITEVDNQAFGGRYNCKTVRER